MSPRVDVPQAKVIIGAQTGQLDAAPATRKTDFWRIRNDS